MNAKSERMQILEMIESGRITASQGLALLEALSSSDIEEETVQPEGELPLPLGDDQVEAIDPSTEGGVADIPLPAPASSWENVPAGETPSDQAMRSSAPGEPFPASTDWEPMQTPLQPPEPPAAPYEAWAEPARQVPHLPADAARWRRWWTIPVWVGLFIAVMGGLFMYASLSAGRIGLGFLCASIPFSLGVLVIVLALLSYRAPWVHLRVQQAPGERPQRIAISFPLPVRPVAWLLRFFGDFIPQVRENSLDEMILAVGQSATRDNPIYIQVDEDDGEKVEIYIG